MECNVREQLIRVEQILICLLGQDVLAPTSAQTVSS